MSGVAPRRVCFKEPEAPPVCTTKVPCPHEDSEPCITLNGEPYFSCQDVQSQPTQTKGISCSDCPPRQPTTSPCPSFPRSHPQDDFSNRRVLPSIPSRGTAAAQSPQPQQHLGKALCPASKMGVEGANKITCPAPMKDTAQKQNDAYRASMYERNTAPQKLTDQLKEMQIEEDFRREHPAHRRAYPRYRGICGSLGNPIFTDTAVAPPAYKAKPASTRPPRYPRPLQQHPMYRTSSAVLGSVEPCLEDSPIIYEPKSQAFTLSRAIGGNYEDCHLTTELNTHPLW